jgi:hypothetical protein
MKLKFFSPNIETLEQLRKEYKKLSLKHHPDRGGRTEDMQTINAEYEHLLKLVGNKRKSPKGETYTKAEYDWTKDRFRDIIEKILNLDVTIEICGVWLWVFGGYACKDQLKALGFFWCSGKKAWAWTDEPKGEKRYHMSLEKIRETFGSEIVKEQSKQHMIAEGIA